MKKCLKKIISFVSAFAILTMGSFSTVSLSADETEGILTMDTFKEFFKPVDDGGLLGESYYNGHEYQVFYQLYNSEVFLRQACPVYNCFNFILSEDAVYEGVHEKVVDILTDYYPDNNFNIPLDEDEANKHTPDTYIDITGNNVYCVYFDHNLTSFDEAGLKEKETSKAVMQKLKEENLISAFYDIGECYDIKEYFPVKYLTYYGNYDVSAVEKYISENGFKCKLEAETADSKYSMHHSLIPDEGVEFEEYFSYAAALYKDLGVKQTFGTYDIITLAYGKNALEDEPVVTTTVPVITATETTSTTVVIINDPEEPYEPSYYNVRDCAFIAKKLADGKADELPETADFNKDGKINIRDAASLAHYLAANNN